MSTHAEVAAELRIVTAQIVKIGQETKRTLAKVVELEAVIASQTPDGSTTVEVDAALAELKAQAKLTDDLVPDGQTFPVPRPNVPSPVPAPVPAPVPTPVPTTPLTEAQKEEERQRLERIRVNR